MWNLYDVTYHIHFLLQDVTDSEDDLSLSVLKSKLLSPKDEKKKKEEILRHGKKIDRMLKVNGLRRVKMSEDGDCFFSALLHSAKTCDKDVVMLRNSLAEHFKSNLSAYRPFMCEDADELVENIRKRGNWNSTIMDIAADYLHSRGNWISTITYIAADYLQMDILIFLSDLSIKRVGYN